MLSNLKGGALIAASVIVVCAIGAATALAWQSILTGTDWLVFITPVLTGVVGITTAHTVGNAVANAINTPVPGTTTTPVVAEQPIIDPPKAA